MLIRRIKKYSNRRKAKSFADATRRVCNELETYQGIVGRLLEKESDKLGPLQERIREAVRKGDTRDAKLKTREVIAVKSTMSTYETLETYFKETRNNIVVHCNITVISSGAAGVFAEYNSLLAQYDDSEDGHKFEDSMDELDDINKSATTINGVMRDAASKMQSLMQSNQGVLLSERAYDEEMDEDDLVARELDRICKGDIILSTDELEPVHSQHRISSNEQKLISLPTPPEDRTIFNTNNTDLIGDRSAIRESAQSIGSTSTRKGSTSSARKQVIPDILSS
jgi:hypothetical protein